MDIDQIESLLGKMLYFINKLYQIKKINKTQRGLLKDLVIAQNVDLSRIYESYVQNGTELTLATDLLHLLKIEKQHEAFSPDSKSSKSSFKVNRGLSVKIPQRSIQKMPGMDDRV